MAVEAKADEPFDRPVSAVLASAVKRRAANERSGGVARVEWLLATLFGGSPAEAALAALRYQLLTATAGAVAEAARAGVGRVVVLVHELRTPKTIGARLARNQADLDAFVRRLSNGAVPSVGAREVRGPIRLPAPSASGVELFVGKARRDVV